MSEVDYKMCNLITFSRIPFYVLNSLIVINALKSQGFERLSELDSDWLAVNSSS